jgi:S-DNA-T family DNA segregation ATPase FtsK/SpoIIIE
MNEMLFQRQPKPDPHNGLRPHVAAWEQALHGLLRHQEVGCQVVDAVRAPQVFTFRLQLADPAQLSKLLALEEQLALVLGVPSVRLARHLGLVHLEVALPRAFHRSLSVRALPRKGRSWVTLGQTATGTPVHVNLAGTRTCHALVSGITGAGKTVTEQLIAWTLATDNEPQQVNLLLIDGKGGAAWWGFQHLPHLPHPVIQDPGEAVAALSWCLAELDRRKANGRRQPALFVVVDEVRELLDVGGQAVAASIQRIAALGRELGLHVVVATQHPLADALGGSIAKANLPLRLTGRVADASAAYLASGVKDSGAEALQGNGDFLVTVAGECHRVQIARVGNREFGQLPRAEGEATPRLDFAGLDLDHVLDLTARPAERAIPIEDEPEALAYALATGCGVKTLRARYRPMGTGRARRIRDLAAAVRQAWQAQGYSYPLLVTDLSAETVQRAGIDPSAVTSNQ